MIYIIIILYYIIYIESEFKQQWFQENIRPIHIPALLRLPQDSSGLHSDSWLCVRVCVYVHVCDRIGSERVRGSPICVCARCVNMQQKELCLCVCEKRMCRRSVHECYLHADKKRENWNFMARYFLHSFTSKGTVVSSLHSY